MEFRIHLHFLMAHPIIAPEKKNRGVQNTGRTGKYRGQQGFSEVLKSGKCCSRRR